ncbi:MAG: apolipoprotein N-acyltransferase [Phycisphaerales bacterium]|nr:MAG: apolipoprotein N-acyltransferase [Phycisphaerales bacterium]
MWKTVCLALAHAVLFVCAFPPIGFAQLAPFALAPLAWLAINARSTRRALPAVFLTQLAMWLWVSRWLIDISVPGYPVLAAYMSVYPLLFAWIVRRAAVGRVTALWPMTAVVPVCWVAMEFLRGSVVAHGYPWFLLAHPMIEMPPLVQSADLGGAYLVSLLVATVSGLLVDLGRMRVGRFGALPLRICGIAVVAVHAANLAYGLWRTNQDHASSSGPAMLVIQTNLPQSNKIKWGFEQQVEDCKVFFDQTVEAVESERSAGRQPDLVIWPETMLPGLGLEPDSIAYLVANDLVPGALFSDSIAGLAEHLQTPLLAGSPAFLGLRVEDEEFRWDHQYNSAYLVTGDPPYQRYDKMFLTPFGETMPYISAWPWLEQRLLALGAAGMSFDLDSNPDPHLIEIPWEGGQLTIPTPICFEDTVAEVCRSMIHRDGGKRSAVFVNLSNDGWFGSHDAGREQHAQIARFRCIENRVPMIRAANTGLSVAIDSNGRVVGSVGRGRYGEGRKPGHLAASLRLDQRRTLYGRIGDSWVWICPVLTAVILTATFTTTKAKG